MRIRLRYERPGFARRESPWIRSRRVLRLSGRLSRKERITAQYDTTQAAADYARAYGSQSRPEGRFLRSRLRLVQDLLASFPGGSLLDAGCGPGITALALLESRPGDFRVTVLDRSPAMVKYCVAHAQDARDVYPIVGELGVMPFADDSFDVTLVMGVLEYTDASAAIRDISRVTRPGGLVVVSMLNPLGPYRLTEWFVYWPLLRILGAIERSLGVRGRRRHGARRSGIHALPVFSVRRLMRKAGLQPFDVVYFDVTPTIPPLDRLPLMMRMAERSAHESTVARGWRGWMGTGYVVAARASQSGGVNRQRERSR